MFSICFQSDQSLITDTKTKGNEYSFSHARPKTKTSDQLVGIADYMGTSLEGNDNHTMHMHKNTTIYMCHNKLSSIQQD